MSQQPLDTQFVLVQSLFYTGFIENDKALQLSIFIFFSCICRRDFFFFLVSDFKLDPSNKGTVESTKNSYINKQKTKSLKMNVTKFKSIQDKNKNELW